MINRALRGLIRLYQLLVSPLLSLLDVAGGGCRFEPTCSRYCLEALAAHGTWRGLWLGAKRLARCAPWGGSGADPVPPAARRGTFAVPPPPPETGKPATAGDWIGRKATRPRAARARSRGIPRRPRAGLPRRRSEPS